MAWLRDVEGLFLPDLPSLGLLAFGSLAGFRALGPGILRQVHWRPCEVRLELSEEELCIRNHLPLVDPPVFHPCSGSLSVGKGTEHTPPAVPVAAGVGFVKPWVVELLLGAVCQRAGEPKRTSSQVVCVRSIQLRARYPAWTGLRRIPESGHPPEVAVSVGIDTLLPIVWATNRAPLRFEMMCHKLFGRMVLFLWRKVRCKQLLTGVCKGTELTTCAVARLVAEALLVKVRMIKELCVAVTTVAQVATGTDSLIVEAKLTRHTVIGRRRAFNQYRTSLLTLAVIPGARTVVMLAIKIGRAHV